MMLPVALVVDVTVVVTVAATVAATETVIATVVIVTATAPVLVLVALVGATGTENPAAEAAHRAPALVKGETATRSARRGVVAKTVRTQMIVRTVVGAACLARPARLRQWIRTRKL